MPDLKQIAVNAIDKLANDLRDISLDIWSHPEQNFEEKYAHAAITGFLEKHGFPVERHYILDTAFRSVFGSGDGGPHLAVLCEYDALPEIGHACGHNLIAEVGLAAAIGIRAAFEAHGQPLGKVTVLGTPAEEGGGGKIDLINGGAFKGIDVAMMAHPFNCNSDTFNALVVESVNVIYRGKAAHAAAFPWEGVNALDAAVLCYQNVSCMRQQFKPSWRVHGVIRNGGTKPNIIPEMTSLEYRARTTSRVELDQLKRLLEQTFRAAAVATGCTVEIKWLGKPYYNIINNKTVSDLYHVNALVAGVDYTTYGLEDTGIDAPAASTDMGNVSYEVPSIHPLFYIGSSAVNHTREFNTAAGDPVAQSYTLAVGKALAMTMIDIFTSQDTLTPSIKAEFEDSLKKAMKL